MTFPGLIATLRGHYCRRHFFDKFYFSIEEISAFEIKLSVIPQVFGDFQVSGSNRHPAFCWIWIGCWRKRSRHVSHLCVCLFINCCDGSHQTWKFNKNIHNEHSFFLSFKLSCSNFLKTILSLNLSLTFMIFIRSSIISHFTHSFSRLAQQTTNLRF